jgi:hypothetical protein
MNLKATNEALTPAAMKERLAQTQRELAALRRKASRATGTAVVITAIALVAICGYFYYGYTQISMYTEPDKLVSYAQQLVDDQLPRLHESVKEQVIQSAPSWAEGLSKQALEAMPTGRAKLEHYIMEQYDSSAQETITLTDKEFRDFLKKNRPLLEQKFKELSKNPELADSSLAELQERLEETLQADMKTQATQLLDTLLALDAKLKKLRAGKDLTPQEQTERRMVMLVSRMRLEEKDPTLAGKDLPKTPRDEIRAVAFKAGKAAVARGRPLTSRPAKPGKPDAKSPAAKPPADAAKTAGTTSKPQADKESKPTDSNDKKEKSAGSGKQ